MRGKEESQPGAGAIYLPLLLLYSCSLSASSARRRHASSLIFIINGKLRPVHGPRGHIGGKSCHK